MKNLKMNINRCPKIKNFLRPFYYHLSGISSTPLTKEILQRLINKPDPTIFEIGCNNGHHTLWFLEIFDNPKIFCFEPEPRAALRFKNNIGERSNVKLFEVALSNNNGETTFYQSGGKKTESRPEGWDQSGSIRKPKNHITFYPEITFKNTLKVKTITLDTFCHEQGIESVDFIWMDAQGAEIDVLRGGRYSLSTTRYIYTEYSNVELYEGQVTFKQLKQELRTHSVLKRYPTDVLFQRLQ